MAKLPKYTLEKNQEKDRWDLVADASDRTVKSFQTKADATRGGALEKAAGSAMGARQCLGCQGGRAMVVVENS